MVFSLKRSLFAMVTVLSLLLLSACGTEVPEEVLPTPIPPLNADFFDSTGDTAQAESIAEEAVATEEAVTEEEPADEEETVAEEEVALEAQPTVDEAPAAGEEVAVAEEATADEEPVANEGAAVEEAEADAEEAVAAEEEAVAEEEATVAAEPAADAAPATDEEVAVAEEPAAEETTPEEEAAVEEETVEEPVADEATGAMISMLPEEFLAALDVADPTRGEQLTLQNACIGCHNLDPDMVMAGPTWYAIAETAAERVEGQDAVEYLYNSIIHPNDHLVEGYAAGIMLQNYGDTLSDQDLADIVAYLLTLQGE